MRSFVALLRAVNVGGTGKLPMADLVRLGEAAGLVDVRTYIASGNMVFRSEHGEAEIKVALEAALADYAGKRVGVLVREGAEMAAVLAQNPFSHEASNRVVAIFLDAPPPRDTLETISGRADEQLALGTREIYIHYGAGMGTSKLKIPAARAGTARNMNTVARLAAMALAP